MYGQHWPPPLMVCWSCHSSVFWLQINDPFCNYSENQSHTRYVLWFIQWYELDKTLILDNKTLTRWYLLNGSRYSAPDSLTCNLCRQTRGKGMKRLNGWNQLGSESTKYSAPGSLTCNLFWQMRVKAWRGQIDGTSWVLTRRLHQASTFAIWPSSVSIETQYICFVQKKFGEITFLPDIFNWGILC